MGSTAFESADTAAARREFRSTRRRYDRRKQRINLLQKEFKDEIFKVDPNFFIKMKESFFREDDKENKTVTISKEEKNKIKDYYKKYPTIYHLRNHLINSEKEEDIRLVYLAIHHIIKNRGNFLYSGNNFDVENLNIKEKTKDIFEDFSNINTDIQPPDYDDYLDLDTFALTISKYAGVKNNDNVFLADETIAEAVHDFYLHGNNCMESSYEIVNIIKSRL